MKRAYWLILLLLASAVSGQSLPADPSTGRFAYSEVVSVPTTSKADLYVRAVSWFIKTFPYDKAVEVEYQDKDAGKLISKIAFPIVMNGSLTGTTSVGLVRAIVTISCKDSRYKYEIDNLVHNGPIGPDAQLWTDGGPLGQEKPAGGPLNHPTKREWAFIKETADSAIKALVSSLKSAMNQPDDF